MKKNLVLIIGMVLFITSLYGQEELNVGKKYNLYSNELHENREYWIYLPDGIANAIIFNLSDRNHRNNSPVTEPTDIAKISLNMLNLKNRVYFYSIYFFMVNANE